MLGKKTFLFIVVVFLGFILLLGCDQIQNAFQATTAPKGQASSANSLKAGATPQVHGTILAKVNNEVITLEEFDGKIQDLEALSPEIKIDTLEDKKSYLNDLITQELIFQEAKSRGLDKQEDVKKAISEFKKGIMARQLILDETKGITVGPDETETFYNQYRKEFAEPQELKVREIVVSSEAAAREILITLLQGGDFATVARERSIASSASQGGDLGFVKAGDKFDKFDEIISTLDVGQVSQIFRGPEGFYIVKVEEKTGGKIPALYEVSDRIKEGLLQQKQAQRIQDLTDRLRREAKIDIKEEVL